jgi:hypothetical protein
LTARKRGTAADKADSGIEVTERTIADYGHDPKNPNRGSERGRTLIHRSLTTDGAGRSLVADADGLLIAGNQTLDAAAAAGITKVVEIATDGDVLIVHRRRDTRLADTEDGRARRLSYSDNRASDDHVYDAAIIAADLDSGVIDDMIFRADELDALMEQFAAEQQVETAAATSTPDAAAAGERLTRQAQIRVLLHARQVDIFEQALTRTGIENRADALLSICQGYLDIHPADDHQ